MARPTSEERALIAQRRTRVLAMRIEHVPYEIIAAREGIAESTARSDYARAIEQTRNDLAATVAQARTLELARLAAMEAEVWKVLRAKHIIVQQGRIVRHEKTGEPVQDHMPVLQAVDRLERISARRARLLGLDAPVKVEVSDEVDAAIRALAAELAAGVGELEPGRETAPAGDPEAG